VWCQMWNLLSILRNDPWQHFRCLFCPQFLRVWKFQRFQNRDWLPFVWSWHEEMEVLVGISLFFAMFRFNPFLTLRDWLIIFLTKFKYGFFNNLTTVESNDWLDLIHVLASGAACTWIVLSLGILLWLRWELTFLLKTESWCEFCKSIFKVYHGLSKLSVDCLLLFHWMHAMFPQDFF